MLPNEIDQSSHRVLGNLTAQLDQLVSELIRERGGSAANVREAGHWAEKSLGEVAVAAAEGDIGAVKAIKIVKNAHRLGSKY